MFHLSLISISISSQILRIFFYIEIKTLAFLQKITKVRDLQKQLKRAEPNEERGDSLQDSNQVINQDWLLVIKLLDKVLLLVFASLFIVLTGVFCYKCLSG